jgi:hypothetical protein
LDICVCQYDTDDTRRCPGAALSLASFWLCNMTSSPSICRNPIYVPPDSSFLLIRLLRSTWASSCIISIILANAYIRLTTVSFYPAKHAVCDPCVLFRPWPCTILVSENGKQQTRRKPSRGPEEMRKPRPEQHTRVTDRVFCWVKGYGCQSPLDGFRLVCCLPFSETRIVHGLSANNSDEHSPTPHPSRTYHACYPLCG